MQVLLPLQLEVGATLQALSVVLIDRVNRGVRSAGAMVELARLNARLCQLQQWLPPGPLMAGLEKLQRLLPALLQPQPATVQQRLLAFVLRLLQSLPCAQQLPLGGYRRSGVAALPLLTSLWRWQQTRAIAEATAVQLTLLVNELANAHRSKAAPRRSAGLLLRLDAVLEFSGCDALHQRFARSAQRLTLAPQSVDDAETLVIWQQLWTLPQLSADGAAAIADCHDLELLQAVHTDLCACRWQLQQFLQLAANSEDGSSFPHDLVLLHYRLPWIVAAAGNAPLADYCRLWLHCLLRHWRLRLELPREIICLMHSMVNLLDPMQWEVLDTCVLARRQLQLLALLPDPSAPMVEVLQLTIVGRTAPVPLDGIPDLLAHAFDALLQAKAEWFASAQTLASHVSALVTELRVLEQGAAAVRMTAVETVASLLLTLVQQGQRELAVEWPAVLLWRTHEHLLDLLDDAAAWQQPIPDQALLADIRSWLQRAQHRGDQAQWMLQEPSVNVDAVPVLSGRLHQFVNSLALTLDQPVHFSVAINGALPVDVLAAGEVALRTLLRQEILAQLQALPQRRQELKPQALTLQLHLDATAAAMVVELTADGVETVPDAAALKRLRRSLPTQVRQLSAASLPGRGRKLVLVIGE